MELIKKGFYRLNISASEACDLDTYHGIRDGRPGRGGGGVWSFWR